MRKRILAILSILLIFMTSIAFSALSTSLSITSEVRFRRLADIRINGVTMSSANNSTIAYESEFSKDIVSNGFTLPSQDSSISYTVHIDNIGDDDYSIYEILKTSSDNGLNVSVSGYNMQSVIPARTSLDVVLTYTTTNPSENVINVVNTFDFKRVFYVTYETGTSLIIPQQMKYEGIDLALTATQPTKTGYTFSKWNTKSDGTGTNYSSGANYTIDDDVTLYARYTLDTYNITYTLNGGTNHQNNPATYTYETNDITLGDATKTGWTFQGWTGNGTTTPTKNLVLPQHSTGNKTFTANFTANTYTINYTMNGGNNPSTKPTSGTYDSDVVISNPTKKVTVTGNANGTGATVGSATNASQIFAGWTSTTIGSNAQTGSTASNHTAWDGTTTTNTHFKNLKESGSVTMISNWTPQAVTLPTLTKPGYTCKWYTQATGGSEMGLGGASWTPSATSSQAVTAYARCTANSYTVTAQANGGTISSTNGWTGTGNSSTKSVTYDQAYGTLPTISRSGYTFKGWNGKNLFETGTLSDYTKLQNSSNISINGNTITAIISSNGNGTGLRNEKHRYASGTYTFTQQSTKNKRHLIYLYDANNNLLDNSTVDISGWTYNQYYKAWFKDTTTATAIIPASVSYWKYGVVFTGSSGDEVQLSDIQIEEGNTATPYETYYITSSTIVTTPNDHEINAIWERNSYTITYETHNGTVSTANPTTYNVETPSFTLNNPTKTLTFKGNYNATSGANAASGQVTIGADTTKAQTFKGWSGTGLTGQTNTSVTVAQGSTGNRSYEAHYTAVAGTVPTVTREGYTCGWSTTSTGTTIEIASGGSYATTRITEGMATTVNLYAVCTPNTYKITYDYRNNIYETDTTKWRMQGNTHIDEENQYNGKQTIAVYSNESAYTGLKLPINNDKKINTNYKMSLYAKRTGSLAGNLRVYATTKDSSGNVLNYNVKISLTEANMPLNTWTAYEGKFNSENYAEWDWYLLDYSNTNQGPIYVSDIRLDEYQEQNKVYGNTLGTLPTPTRTGYTFAGWYTTAESGGTQVSSSTTIPSADTTYYARWTPDTYTITYTLKNGTVSTPNPTTYNIETPTFTLNNPTKTLTFVGHYNATTAANAASGSGVTIGSNTTKAQTFAGWGENDNLFDNTATPYKTGFYLMGDGTEVSNGSYKLYQVNVEPNTRYTIVNGGSVTNPGYVIYNSAGTRVAGENYQYRDSITFTTPSNAAYIRFSVITDTSRTDCNKDTFVLEKTSTTKKISIGSTGNKSFTAHYTGVAGTLPTVTRTGYVCGWNLNSNGTTRTYTSGGTFPVSAIKEAMATTVNLYAVCTANTYNISYALNGGEDPATQPTSGTYDANVIISNPTKTFTVNVNGNNQSATIKNAQGTVVTSASSEQTFLGWSSTVGSHAQTGSTANNYASWNGTTKTTNTYFKNLTDTNNGTVTMTANWTPVAVTLPNVTKTGYQCKYNTASNGSGTDYASGGSYTPSATTNNATLYVICTANTYTINYTMNGGNNPSTKPTSGTYDANVNISNPTKTVTVTGDVNGTGATVGSATSAAQTFLGWSSTTIGSNAQTGSTTSSYVAWNGTDKTKNTYFKNLKESGTVTMVANWTPVAVTLPSLNKTGFTCKWYTEATGGSELGLGGGSYTPTANSSQSITVYARCSERDDTTYRVNHYVHDLGTNTYTLNSHDDLTGRTNSTVTLANLKKTIPGFTYVDGYITGNTTKPTSGAVTTTTILSDGSRVINLYYRRNYLYIQYHINGGTLTAVNNAYGVSGNLVTNTNNTTPTNFLRGVYGSKVGNVDSSTYATSGGLHNYNGNSINITKTGYTAPTGSEWNTQANGLGTSYGQDDTNINANGFAGADLSAGDAVVTIYVKWMPVNYTITYATNNGINNANNPGSYTIESEDITIQNPTKTITFKGNYNATSGANAANGQVTIGADTTQAQTFKGWSGTGLTGETNKPVVIAQGSTGNRTYTAHWTSVAPQVLPTVTREGYTCGWNSSPTGTTIQYDNSGEKDYPANAITEGQAATVNLYAVCVPNTYTITYNYNNVSQITFTNGESAQTGYIIDWDKDFTINGVWKYGTANRKYLVIGNYDDGSKTLNIELTTGNKFRILMGSGLVDAVSTTTAQASVEITYTYSWVASTQTYTFTATSASTNVSMTGTANMSGQATKQLVYGTRDHRTTTSEFTTTTYHRGLSITKQYVYGNTLSNPTPVTKPQYAFNGWFTATSGGQEVTDSTSVPSADTTYYAQWTVNTYQVKFNANGGVGTMANMTFNYDQSKTLTANAFTREGYTFIGWSNGSSTGATSGIYYDGQSVSNLTKTNGGTVNLYALWQSNTYQVAFDANGGTGTMSNQTIAYSAEDTLTANSFTRTGYTYTKWNTQANATGIDYNNQASMNINPNMIGGTSAPVAPTNTTGYAYSGRWAKTSTSLTPTIIDVTDAPSSLITKGFNIPNNTTSANYYIYTQYLLVDYNQPYTLSVYAKGSGTLILRAGNSTPLKEETFTLTNTWTRYSMKVIPVNSNTAGTYNARTSGRYLHNIGFGTPSGNGAIQVAGLKFETGETPTEYIDRDDQLNLYAQWTANELVFNNQTLSTGTYGTAYTSNAFTGATNGTGSYTYTIKSGAPTGATINSTNRTISFTNSTAAGTYNVVVTATDNNSNKTKDATMTIVINPATNPTTFTAATGLKYGSTADLLTVANKQGTPYYAVGTQLTSSNYSSSGSTTIPTATSRNAGTYTVYYYIPAVSGKYAEKSGSVSVTIGKATATNSVVITGTNTYGETLTATITTNSNGTKGYQWYSNSSNSTTGGTAISGATSSTYTIGPGLVGKYIYVVASVGESINYTTPNNSTDITDASANTTATVAARAITIKATDQTVNYGTAITNTVAKTTISSGSLASGDELTAITLTPSTTNYTTNGTITPSAATISKSNTNVTSNYSISYATGVLKINKVAPTNSVTISGTNTYGETLTATITTNSDGAKSYQWYSNSSNSTTGGTAISGATSSTYTIGPGLVDKYIYVKASVGAGTNWNAATDAYDITDASANTTAKVAARAITIKATDQTINYGGSIVNTVAKTTISSGTLVSGDELTAITLTPSTTNYTTNGTITPSAATISKSNTNVTSNYNISYATGVLKINKVDATCPTVSNYNAQYDGNTHTIGVTGSASGGTLKFSTDNSTWSTTNPPLGPNAGTNTTVYVRVEGDGNHNTKNCYVSGTTSPKVTITKKTATNSVVITGTNTWGNTLTATITTNSNGTKGYKWYYSTTAGATSGGTAINDTNCNAGNTCVIPQSLVGKYIYVVGSVGESTNYTTPADSVDATDASTNGTQAVAKKTCPAPTNVAISTAGAVTWTAASGASSYQISIDNSTFTAASSGVDYKNTITAAAGSRTVYVRSVCSTTYYSSANSANATKSINVYSVTLTKGTGISAVSGAGNYITGSTAAIDATVSTGYTWSKWTQTTGGAEVTTTKNYSATITANWAYTATTVANGYTIAYAMNNGPNPSTKPTSGAYNADVVISNPGNKTVTITPNVNNSGATVGSATTGTQTFSGWTSSSSAGLGSGAKTGTSANPSTAWTGTSTKNTYFKNLRDSSGTVTMTANWSGTATLPTLSKPGYTCKYYTEATGGTEMGAGGATWTIPSGSATSVTAYARCTINQYTLTINPNNGTYNGSTSSTTVTQDYGTTYDVYNNPTREAYVFTGWKLTSGNGNITYFDDSEIMNRYIINSINAAKPGLYNNKGGGTVTLTNIADATSSTGYSMRITTNGEASPGAGGFVNSNTSTSGALYYHKVVAKIPVGYTIAAASNSMGAGYSTYWITDTAGTGDWETYIYATAAGYNGPFSNFGHVYINGSNNTNVTWYINESTIYRKGSTLAETQASNIVFEFVDSNATLTAQWSTGGVSVTWDKQNGIFGDGTTGTKWTATYTTFRYLSTYADAKKAPYYISASDFAFYRTGYTFNGWYTAASGGTQIFNSEGRLNASVAGYSDANRKWLKYDENVTLYAHWSKPVSDLNTELSQTTFIYNGSNQGPTVSVKDGNTALASSSYTVSGNSNTNVGQHIITITGTGAYDASMKAYYTGSTNLTYNINNATLTFDKGSCTSVSGATTLYTRKDATVVYTGLSEITTTGTIPTASKSGYVFQGWYTASSGGNKVLNANGTFSGTAVSGYTNSTSWQTVENKTLYARCSRDTYSITYSMNNGANNANNPDSYTVDSPAITIVGGEKTLIFKGNYNATSGANAASGQVTIGEDVSVSQTFAGWTGSNGSTAQTTVTIPTGSTGDKSYTAHWTAVAPEALPTVTRTGYTCGWSTSSTGTTIEYASGATNYPTSAISEGQAATVNLYAVCEPKKIHLTLNPAPGTGGTTDIWYYYNTNVFYSDQACTNEITSITTPTRSGYSFSQYYGDGTSGGTNQERYIYYNGSFSGNLYYDIYQDATLYSKWSKATSNLTITLSATDFTYNGEAQGPSIAVKDGNTLLTEGTDYTIIGNSNTDVGQYDIRIAGTGTYNATTHAFYTGETTRTYYISNAELEFNSGSCENISGSTTLYTKKGATGVFTTLRGTDAGTIPTASKTGYTFNGWYTAASGGSKVLNANGSFTGTAVSGYTNATSWQVTSKKTLYAQCTPTTYTVTANANGGAISATTGWTGTGNTATKQVTYNSAYGTLPNVSKTGYTLNGWTLLSDGSLLIGNASLPAGYTQLNYIESTGTQYINLDYMLKKNQKALMKFEFTQLGNQAVFGTYSGNYIETFGLSGSSKWEYRDAKSGWVSSTTTAVVDTLYEAELYYGATSQYLKVNGTKVLESTAVHTNNVSSIPAFLLSRNSNGTPNYSTKGKLYSFKLYDGDTLVRDMVPCIEDSTGKVGMYDKVNDVFYENSGTGSFIAGDVAYITSDTIVKKSENHNIYADWTINNPATPTITGGATKVYGLSSTTLTCSTSTNYINGATKYYSFGYADSDGGTPGNWTEPSTSATKTIGATEYVGQRWYSCRVYVSDGTQTSSTVASLTSADTEMTINNAKLTFNAGSCDSVTGSTTLYTKKGATVVYTGLRETSATGTIPTATKTGYTFNGWYTASTGGSKVLNANGTFTGTAVTNYTNATSWQTTADRTLYAQCSATTYTVTANANGGTIASTTGWSGTGNTATKSVTYNAAYGTLPTVTRTGYTFNGWNGKNLLNIDHLQTYGNWSTTLAAYGNYPTSSSNPGYLLNTESGETYTISYTTPSSSELPPYFYLCRKTSSTTSLVAYLTTDSIVNTTYTFTAESGYDYYLRAAFSTENVFNDRLSKISTIQLEKSSSATSYEPYYITTTTPVTVAGNHTINAQWAADDHSVTYNCSANGGSGTIANATLVYGDPVDLSKTCTPPSGFTHIGWHTTQSSTTALSSQTMGTSNITLYAIYKSSSTLTANLANNNGATFASISQLSCYRYNNANNCYVSVPAITAQSGFTTLGINYATSASDALNLTSKHSDYSNNQLKITTSTTGKTWYPVTRSSSQYTGTFTIDDTNAATGGGTASCYRYNGATSCKITAATLTAKSGYTVYGWNTTKGATSATVASGQTNVVITGNTTYWSVTKYNTVVTITFNRNTTNSKATSQTPYGGSASTAATVTSSCTKYNGSTSCSVTSPTMAVTAGYHAVGYNTAANPNPPASTWNVNTAKDVSVDATYYAITAPNTYSIKFNANCPSGTTAGGSMSNLGMTYGTAANLTANGFTCTNREFAGWATSTTGAVTYSDGESVNNLTTTDGATVNLYARWKLLTPSPSISGGATKIFGSSTTTITCTESTSYPSGATKHYAFGYATSASATAPDENTWTEYSNDNYITIAADAYVGTRYYFCRVYANTSTETSATQVTSTTAALTIKNAKITFVANSCGTISGTNPAYVNTLMTGVYQGETNTDAGAIPTTSKTGYTFTGWYDGNTQVINGSGVINSSVSGWTGSDKKWLLTTAESTLTAHCTANTYAINYTMNGGNDPSPKPTQGSYDSDINIGTPEKTFTVNVNKNGNSVTVKDAGGNVVTDASATQAFAGWTSTTIGTNAKSGTTSNNHAAWDGSATTNTHFKNLRESGTVTMVANWTPAAVTLPTLSKTGWTCKYNTAANGSGTNYASAATYTPSSSATDVTLYVICTKNQYEVVLNGNSGTIPTTSGWTVGTNGDSESYAYKTVTYGNPYGTLPTPTRLHYEFGGWSNELVYGNLAIPAANTANNYRVIATNIQPGVTYKVLIDNAEVTSGSATQYTIRAYDFTTDTVLKAVNVDFGTNRSTDVKVPTTADRSHQIRLIIYSGKSGSCQNVATLFTNITVQTANEPQSGSIYTAESNVRTARIHALNAFWEPADYTITYNLDYGTNSQNNPATYNIETETFTLEPPERNGYTFTGWSGTDLTGNNNMTVTIPRGSTGNRTYTAHWTVNNYTLDLNGLINSSYVGNISGCGTADVWINGTQVANDVTDYYESIQAGSTFLIDDLKATEGKGCTYIGNSSYTGTIEGGDVSISVPFTFNGKTYQHTGEGGIQSFTVPVSGTYKLEVWGAQGGTISTRLGGKGGYVNVAKCLTAGTTVYVGVGGSTSTAYGGYNGGGNGNGTAGDPDTNANNSYARGGGGATHIGAVNAQLKDYTSAQQNPDYVFAVAGGGGGCGEKNGGGAGGKLNGFDGIGAYGGKGGSSTEGHGGAGGQDGAVTGAGSFGLGGNANPLVYIQNVSRYWAGGGGGGLYGGGGGDWSTSRNTSDPTWSGGGGGGSGTLGLSGYPEHEGSDSGGSDGVREGDGLAQISWLHPCGEGGATTYSATYDYNINQTFATHRHIDTYYAPNWSKSFDMDITFTPATTGKRYLLISNYDKTATNAIGIEVDTNNKLRVWVGRESTPTVNASFGSVTIGTTNTVHVEWRANSSVLTITGSDGASGTYTNSIPALTGVATRNLRIGSLDYREGNSDVFEGITVNDFSITQYFDGPLSTAITVPDPAGHYLLFDGWTGSNGNTPQYGVTVPVGTNNNVTYTANWSPGVSIQSYKSTAYNTSNDYIKYYYWPAVVYVDKARRVAYTEAAVKFYRTNNYETAYNGSITVSYNGNSSTQSISTSQKIKMSSIAAGGYVAFWTSHWNDRSNTYDVINYDSNGEKTVSFKVTAWNYHYSLSGSNNYTFNLPSIGPAP